MSLDISKKYSKLIWVLCLVFLGSPIFSLEINIWDYPRWLEPGETVDRFAWIKKQILAFESENPGIKVKLTELTWNRGDEKLKIASLGGQYPDIAPGGVPLLLIKENLIEPVDEYLEPGDLSDYLEGALKAFKVNGKTYGWPWYMGGQLLFFNRALLASAGVTLPANGRWTPEEFIERMTRVKEYFADKPGHFPLGLYFQKNETGNFPFAFIFGGDWISPEQPAAGVPRETILGLNWLRNFIKAGLAPPDSGGRTPNDIWSAFAVEKRIAGGVFGLWAIKPLTDPKKFLMDYEITHFPSPANKVSPAFLGISGYYVFRRPDPDRMKMAMKFARFLTSTIAQKALARYTQFPTRRSAGNLYPESPAMTRAWEVLQEGRTIIPDSRWPQMDEEIESAVQNVLLERVETKTAMDECNVRLQAILANPGGSLREDLQKGSWIGKVYLFLFPLVILLAILSRQVHLIFIVPALGTLGLFLYYPFVDALVLAFRDYRIGEVGGYTVQNFARAIADPKFAIACKNTFLFTVIVVPANVFTALVVSSLVYSLPKRSMGFFRAMYYLPGVASVVVLSMAWKWLFNRELGLFNLVLTNLGFSPVGWLSDPSVAFFSIILTGILRSPGGSMLIYLAALSNIPKSLYEAADLEGATGFQKWRHITVPLLRETTMFLLITGTIDALQVFAQVLMLTDGGPASSTEVVVHRVYTAAFRDFDFGVSSAMALLLFFVILAITLFQKRFQRGDVEEMA